MWGASPPRERCAWGFRDASDPAEAGSFRASCAPRRRACRRLILTSQARAKRSITLLPPLKLGRQPLKSGLPREDTSSRSPVSPAAPSAVATPAPPALPIPTPTVTLGNGPSKERAQHLLDDTAAKLAKVDRGTLGADSANTYDQANNLLQAGRRAATEDDYVAASGFAEKAAVLAAKLAPASP